MLASYFTGLIVCGGIIVAIGAQNAYILGQAIRREHHWTSAGICMGADILYSRRACSVSTPRKQA